MEELQAIIKEFDSLEKKGFDEHDFSSALRVLYPPKESGEPIPFELQSESIAFDLVENYHTDNYSWGTYFGPMWVSNDGNGNLTEAPALAFVTQEVIDYWEKRIEECSNPILKARYAGLVWDLKEKQTGNKPHFDVCKKYISALIEVAKGDYHKYDISTYIKLDQALKWAISINDSKLINDAKTTLITFEKTNAKDTLPGTWGYSFEWLMKNSKIFSSDEENDIISDLTNRLERLKKLEIDGAGEEKFDPWSIENNAKLLANYYKRKGDNKKTKQFVDDIRDAIYKVLPNGAAMQKSAWLETVYKIYKEYQFDEDAKIVLAELAKIGESIVEEMGKISVPFEIPNDKLQEYLKDMTSGSFEEVIAKFVFRYIPNKEDNKKQLLEIAKKNPLQFLFSTQLIDAKGRVVAKIGGIETDLEGQLLIHISQSLQISTFFVRSIIQKMIELNLMTKDSIIDFLKKSPVFEKDRYEFIEKGLDAYFVNDYITAIHLLIPQIENAIRNIIEKTGGLTLEPSRCGGFNLKTFDKLLRDENLIATLGIDFTNYFRILFTEQRGWNLRNNVCHGIANLSHFNYATADRVLHALLCLGFINFE
jgi:hypothetical protein